MPFVHDVQPSPPGSPTHHGVTTAAITVSYYLELLHMNSWLETSLVDHRYQKRNYKKKLKHKSKWEYLQSESSSLKEPEYHEGY